MSDPHHPAEHPTVEVTLDEGWHEEIPRHLAIERLEARALPSDEVKRITETIPDVTHHYLIFGGRAFREYVDFGEGFVHVSLFLPMEVSDEGFKVIIPVYRSDRFPDGRPQHLIGIDEHLFRIEGEQLIENGKPRLTFKPIRVPLTLRVETTMVMPPNHPTGSACCDACEWVHSALDIHCADWLCCLGCC